MRMKVPVGVFICLLVTLKYTSQADINIAIIGGGIGGTSCAYFLKQIFNDNVSIDLYEGDTIGGRLATVALKDGNEYEAGGSIIHERNRYMSSFVDINGLEKNNNAVSERVGLYTNDGFEFIESSNHMVNIMKTLWRYGYGIKEMKNFIDDLLNKFDRIYEHQAAGHSYDTVNELLMAMDPAFSGYLNISIKDAFLNLGYSEKLIEEIVKASIKVNYGQDVNVHQFVGAVSLAGMDGSLWAIKGGNKQVAEKLLNLSNARLIQEYVVQVTQNNNNNETSYMISTNTGRNLTYDYVVFAAPLAENQKIPIIFTDISSPLKNVGKYHRTVSTFVVGKLRNEKFTPLSDGSDAVLVIALNENEFFNSIGNIESVASSSILRNWKVFSREPLTSYQLNELFESISEVKSFDWLAYPHYEIPSKSLDFQLSDRLYHINAIEWAASAMEMSCVGAKNVALLIKKNIDSNWNETNKWMRVEL
ncbi:prenylcysteine oxidase 1-like [Adelges cooleyi]|uniref:prenylcysteine oxidase 1-like n=1 Tax=Adelges cooleyi TaxID=133065 RepID=UPI002180970C|nr:prenylcysteine oxidase 1-like [Adelges cooleyi]